MQRMGSLSGSPHTRKKIIVTVREESSHYSQVLLLPLGRGGSSEAQKKRSPCRGSCAENGWGVCVHIPGHSRTRSSSGS